AKAEEKARFEEVRTAWEWGREQAAQTQAAWQQTRADWEQERSAWRKEREAHAEAVSQLQRQAQDAAAQCQAQERALAEQRQAHLAGALAGNALEAAPEVQNGPVVTGAIAARRPAQGRAATNEYLRYQLLVRQVRQLVCQTVPAGAAVVVISKGDDELLRLEG